MSASARCKIAAAQKARWAKLRRAKRRDAFDHIRRQSEEERFSAASRAKLSAKRGVLGEKEIKQEVFQLIRRDKLLVRL